MSPKKHSSASRFSSPKAISPDFGIFVLFLSLIVVGANWFLFQYLAQEKWIYFWDEQAYHNEFSEAVLLSRKGLFEIIKGLLEYTAHSPNSIVVPFLISPFGRILGDSRPVYLFSVLNVFAMPAAIVLGLVLKNMIGLRDRLLGISTVILLTFLNPAIWIPLFDGFYDVVIVVLIGWIWLLMAREREGSSWVRVVLIGILLACLLLTRRWLGYWLVCFFLALVLQRIWCHIRKSKDWFWDWKSIFLSAASAGLFLVVFSWPWMVQVLGEDYSREYQIYKEGQTTFQAMLLGLEYIGWLPLLFSIWGFFWVLNDKKWRPFAQVIGFNCAAYLFFFSRVQELNSHHEYPIAAFCILFQSCFLYRLWSFHQWTNGRKVFWTLILALASLLGFFRSLVPQFPFHFKTSHVLFDSVHYPRQRGDLLEVYGLVGFLDQKVKKGDGIYVAACSYRLNSSLLHYACMGRYGRAYFALLPAADVDSRDGFQKEFFDAKYVVIGDPAQTFGRKGQDIIIVLCRGLLNHELDWPRYQEVEKVFELDDGVRARIYERKGEWTPAQKEKLRQTLRAMNPELPNAFPASAFGLLDH